MNEWAWYYASVYRIHVFVCVCVLDRDFPMCFSVCGNPVLGHTITISSAEKYTLRLLPSANIMVSMAKYIGDVAGAQ